MGEENDLNCRQRVCMCLWPCTYLNKPDIASSDCCLCCHESPKVKELDIPPLIEMSGTWISPDNPIPIWFIILRLSLTIGVIAMFLYNLILYGLSGNIQYWAIYFTQWNIVLASISMILKSISTIMVHKSIRNGLTPNRLYITELSSDSKLWSLHIAHDICVQITIPSQTLVVIKFSVIQHCINNT